MQNHDPSSCLRVRAPGKLILSGEHAVVYGNPALAMAVNRYATASITRELSPRISFDFSDLPYQRHLSFSTLRRMKDRIKRKYRQFTEGHFSIREVLHKPFELAQFAFGLFFDTLNIALPHDMRVHVQSDIPMGCGMGSSAATIVSVIYAIAQHLHLDLSTDTLFHLALAAENMQHGHSSGLDLRVSLQCGCLYMHGSTMTIRPAPTLSLYLIHTGTPLSSTGRCVEKVAPYFRTGLLSDDFARVTQAMDQALREEQWHDFKEAIQQNHRLLMDIGVVPEKVQQFIDGVEQTNGVAKICGAGAVEGDHAGIVLAITDDVAQLTALCAQYQYTLLPIISEPRGGHV